MDCGHPLQQDCPVNFNEIDMLNKLMKNIWAQSETKPHTNHGSWCWWDSETSRGDQVPEGRQQSETEKWEQRQKQQMCTLNLADDITTSALIFATKRGSVWRFKWHPIVPNVKQLSVFKPDRVLLTMSLQRMSHARGCATARYLESALWQTNIVHKCNEKCHNAKTRARSHCRLASP